MDEPLYKLKHGEGSRIARAIGKTKVTVSKALRGLQCSVKTARAIELATNGKVKAVVLLGLKPPPEPKAKKGAE